MRRASQPSARPAIRTRIAVRVLTALALGVASLTAAPAAVAPVGAQETHRQQAQASVSHEELVDDAYRELLGRAPDAGGRQHWLDRLGSGTSQRTFLDALATTDEHRRHLVSEAFRTYLEREADAGGLGWYVDILGRSHTATTVRADLLSSSEYVARAGGTNEAWVDALYRDVLGRGPEAAGRQYFLEQLAAGVPRQPLASAVLVSPEAAARTPLGIVEVAPERQSLVRDVDAIDIQLDRSVIPQAATVIVTMDGQPVPGEVSQGDFDDVLVFRFGTVPDSVEAGERVRVGVVVVAHSGDRVGRADAGFHYERPLTSLSRGDQGQGVVDLQNRLAHLGYWIGPVDGQYGSLTQQAVYAFQKAEGLDRSGVADPATRQRLAVAERPRPRSTSGYVFEIDKARQLVIMAVDGRAVWVWNTSTGTEEPYTFEGRRYLADTPPGRWEVYRQVDGIREGALGRLYRPKYFHTDGIAFHGYPSVPPYPASHGCVRLTNAAMDWIWANDVMPIGVDVWVY